ncbi:MAG: aldo/keto reductase [cyanobacterium endosymbiont of Rhopalodia musculus]|uniref:aldo/keto reductase n=1 Tax=cyanobacterium endosymbiont of Epithemia clementina EcSB TaxID=3034674 RepID=UPI00247FB19E|nr:aldo/keto reductase [cyanobacterium endosymbiont of Epithemia clementina EcSB]WGT67639.1 aldo/keto reductase [cyanobacterium endosymbiont of Epithemia clementina EcSB]
MHYRRFGKTNLLLSVFSLGTMRCLSSEAIFKQTIELAITSGINHFEMAKGYGNSERYLGQFLVQQPSTCREKIYITTKLPPTPDPDQMSQWLDESLQLLQVDYLDCLAIHGINTWDHLRWLTQPNGCWLALQKALDNGKIHHLGFSTHGNLDLILETIKTDLFEFVNLHYYYFFQRNAAAIVLAAQKDLGIFIISPGDKGGGLYTPPDRLQSLCEPFSPLELTYRFLLSDNRITTLSVGAANPEELAYPFPLELDVGPLTLGEIEVFQRLEKHTEITLGSEHCRQCYQCLPCPETINIPEVLRLRNLAVAYDMTDFAQYRYRMFENAAHWFPGNKGNHCTECGDCLPRCPEKLKIPKLLQSTHQQLNGLPRRRLWE